MNIRPAPTQHLIFDPRAADLLALVRDLQHVDRAGLEELTDKLVKSRRPNEMVGYDELRQMLAIWLFDHEAKMRPEQVELLRVEWARLFS